jgi:hypothetical protein
MAFLSGCWKYEPASTKTLRDLAVILGVVTILQGAITLRLYEMTKDLPFPGYSDIGQRVPGMGFWNNPLVIVFAELTAVPLTFPVAWMLWRLACLAIYKK